MLTKNFALNESACVNRFHCTYVIADVTNPRVGLEDFPIEINSVGFLGDI